jgi:Skp family chaperone for outer membrane proteins
MKKLKILALATGVLCGAASAQPDINAGKAENPANRNAAQRAQKLERKAGKEGAAATLLERENKRRQLRLERLPKSLTSLGVTDAKVQDAVVTHLKDVSKTQSAVLEAQIKLRRSLLLKTTPEAQLRADSAAVSQAKKDYEAAFQKSLDALDKKINYSKSPRLEAVLLSLGALDPDGLNGAF